MSIHGGSSSLGSRSRTVQITTTLYELMEAMEDKTGAPWEARASMISRKHPGKAQDRVIARKVAGMFLSGRIKFKRPRDIRNSYPEWFE